MVLLAYLVIIIIIVEHRAYSIKSIESVYLGVEKRKPKKYSKRKKMVINNILRSTLHSRTMTNRITGNFLSHNQRKNKS